MALCTHNTCGWACSHTGRESAAEAQQQQLATLRALPPAHVKMVAVILNGKGSTLSLYIPCVVVNVHTRRHTWPALSPVYPQLSGLALWYVCDCIRAPCALLAIHALFVAISFLPASPRHTKNPLPPGLLNMSVPNMSPPLE